MSTMKDWASAKQTARAEEQRRRKEEYEAMPPEERKAASRRQLVSWLKMFQDEKPIMYINGKAQDHQPMTKEEADLHLALFDGEVNPTPEVKLELAQLEAIRYPNSKKMQGKLWKAMQDCEDAKK
jgi:hypothetical protein